ncbi:ATP-binding protein [Streptomyces sp. NPDC102462]|uniref:ATP-binding protein n=1 Tax=Streptomyces sp. NPDC102462 TaxID=3366178 RepID=UPI0038038CAD
MALTATGRIERATLPVTDRTFRARIAFAFPRTPVGADEEPAARDLVRVGEVRRICGGRLRNWGLERLDDSVRLLLSELVTNAIQHGSGSQVGVRLSYAPGEVRIEVRSGPVNTLTARDPGLLDEDGRGLLLVDALADAWGVDAAGWVWCVLATA